MRLVVCNDAVDNFECEKFLSNLKITSTNFMQIVMHENKRKIGIAKTVMNICEQYPSEYVTVVQPGDLLGDINTLNKLVMHLEVNREYNAIIADEAIYRIVNKSKPRGIATLSLALLEKLAARFKTSNNVCTVIRSVHIKNEIMANGNFNNFLPFNNAVCLDALASNFSLLCDNFNKRKQSNFNNESHGIIKFTKRILIKLARLMIILPLLLFSSMLCVAAVVSFYLEIPEALLPRYIFAIGSLGLLFFTCGLLLINILIKLRRKR